MLTPSHHDRLQGAPGARGTARCDRRTPHSRQWPVGNIVLTFLETGTFDYLHTNSFPAWASASKQPEVDKIFFFQLIN